MIASHPLVRSFHGVDPQTVPDRAACDRGAVSAPDGAGMEELIVLRRRGRCREQKRG